MSEQNRWANRGALANEIMDVFYDKKIPEVKYDLSEMSDEQFKVYADTITLDETKVSDEDISLEDIEDAFEYCEEDLTKWL